MTKHALITVRAASSRLPRKCFLDFGGKTVIQHVIDRCNVFGYIPIVATTHFDDEIASLCVGQGVKCYAGSVDDKLNRWLEACIMFEVDRFIAVDCDDPFFDKGLCDLAFSILSNDETIDVCFPDESAYLGSMGWGLSTRGLKKICDKKVSEKTEMIWQHFSADIICARPQANADPIELNLRLTLDYEEDYWLLRTVIRELGSFCSRGQVIDFFRANPGLRVVNQFRNDEWKRRQQELSV